MLVEEIINTSADASIHTSAIPVTNSTASQFFSPKDRPAAKKHMDVFLRQRDWHATSHGFDTRAECVEYIKYIFCS